MKKIISKNIFIGSGVINVAEENISINRLKEEIEKKYRLKVMKESTTYIKCKILRVFSIFGFLGESAMFPNPTLTIKLDNKMNKEFITINFFWPDYYFIMIAALISGIISMTFILPIFIIISFGILDFVHTEYVYSRIWKILLNK